MGTLGFRGGVLRGGLLLALAASAVMGCHDGGDRPRDARERIMFEPDGLLVTGERAGHEVIGRVYGATGETLNETSTAVADIVAEASSHDDETLLRLGAAQAYANYADDLDDERFRQAACGNSDLGGGCRYHACEDTEIGDYWCIECTSSYECFSF